MVHDIFNAFYLSFMCVQKPFCINFYVSFSLFAGNLSKDERGSFWAINVEKLPPTELVTFVIPMTIRRWHRSEANEGRWGSLTKCGITKLVTVRRGYDGPSYLRSRGMKIAAEEIAQVWDDRVHDGPSTKPRFGRFPAIRILV